MNALVESGKPWGVVWQCAHEFLAIVTHPKIYKPPTPMEVALEEIRNWTEAKRFRWIAEGEGHFGVLERVLREGRVRGGQVHDARIAAVCLQHRVDALWSVDRDFSRFPELRVVNPLG